MSKVSQLAVLFLSWQNMRMALPPRQCQTQFHHSVVWGVGRTMEKKIDEAESRTNTKTLGL